MTKAKKKEQIIEIEGLEEMVNTAERVEAKAEYDLRNIPHEEIAYHPENKFGMRDLEKLASAIETEGLLHNLVVRPFTDDSNPTIKYQLISGERRHRATASLGWKTVPCKVVECDDLEAERKLIVVNYETRELSEIEKAYAVERLYQIVEKQRSNGVDFDGKRTREVVSEMMTKDGKSMSPAVVGQLKKLTELIDEFKPLVESGQISRETAYQFAQMPSEQQKLVYETFAGAVELTARTAKELKESLAKSNENHEQIIEQIKKQLDDKEEALTEAVNKNKQLENEKTELSDKLQALEKDLAESIKNRQELLDSIEADKKKLADELRETLSAENQIKLNELEEQLKNATDEKTLAKLKADIERTLRESISAETQAIVDELESKIKKAESQVHDALEKERFANERLDEAKNLLNEKKNIEANFTIQLLAKQTSDCVQKLTSEIIKYTSNIQGFELDDVTKNHLKHLIDGLSGMQKIS